VNSKTELELLNGSWMILSLSLSIICAIYLRHEIVARWGAWRPLTWRKHFTRGMSVATAVMLMAIGICIRSAAVFLCFCTSEDRPFSPFWLTVGGLVSVAGFICTVREISHPLYGSAPWVWTLVSLVAFVVYEMAIR